MAVSQPASDRQHEPSVVSTSQISLDHQHEPMVESTPQTSLDHGRPAEWLLLPQDRIVTVEHPCIVKNFDNGLKSLGGENHIRNLLAPAGQTLSVGLSLRPHDPLAKKLVSREVPVNNILLRVTLPKRTGRKRKRGSNEPFAFHGDAEVSSRQQGPTDSASQTMPADQLLGRLRDNEGRYSIQPVGLVKETHRFRALPDFQVKAGGQAVMKEVARYLTDATLSNIKSFSIDTRPGAFADADVLPPPSFTSFEQSMNYGYRQNPGVSTITDDQGQIKTINLQKPKKRAVLAFEADVAQIPTEPPPNLEPLEQTNAYLKQAVKNIAHLLKERPVVTRRVAMNLIEWGSESLFKEATQYVGYSFKSGPWRDALIKYGVDPRTDAKYRVYQTLSFQLMSKDKLLAAAKRMPDGKNTWIRSERYKKDEQPSHIFDGKGITTNGKTWQICDIKEPMISGLLTTTDLRPICDNDGFGWYQNGTMSKVRIIMRDMIGMMLLGQTPDYASYETLARIPNIIDPHTYSGCYFDKEKYGEKVMALSGEIRNLAKTDLIMKAKMRMAVEAGEPIVQSRNGRERRLSPTRVDGSTEGAEEDALEEEVEGDDLNASDDADGGADVMDEDE